MKILISGSTGFLGGHLVTALKESGHLVMRLIRQGSRGIQEGIQWDPYSKSIKLEELENLDAVIHLAGENIISRWSKSKKTRILKSRKDPTRFLAEALAGINNPPRTLLSASAVGIYGNRGDEPLYESSSPGSGFLVEVCREWEAATRPAAEKGIRVVNLRFGIILSSEGGTLAKMLVPFRIGLGGRIGDGRQYMSWVAIDDVVRIIIFLLSQNTISGPVNLTAPNPVTNSEFTKKLAQVISRPAFFPLPAFMARLIFGEMADSLLLSSERVYPAKLVSHGYIWKYPILDDALRYLLENVKQT